MNVKNFIHALGKSLKIVKNIQDESPGMLIPVSPFNNKFIQILIFKTIKIYT